MAYDVLRPRVALVEIQTPRSNAVVLVVAAAGFDEQLEGIFLREVFKEIVRVLALAESAFHVVAARRDTCGHLLDLPAV